MIGKLLRDRTAASAAEFAVVLPLLLLFIFGIIDVGRWIWTYNKAEKAAQMGARMAVVTNPLSSSLTATYVGACSPALTQGDLIPADCFSTVTCTSTGCSDGSTEDTTAFNAIVARMQKFLPQVTAANVAVEYTSSGLGYAGNPNGPDISPLVTVKIGTPATALQFTPITSMLLATMTMPNFTTTLTAEDLSGSQSN